MKLPGMAEISELAEFVANQYCPSVPIQPQTIAEAKGITFSFGGYRNAFDGLIEHRSGKFHIYINTDRLSHGYTERARFTFAHELGHYFIDDHRNALASGMTPSHPSFTDFSSRNIVERQADFFAACLLMPEDRIRSDCYRRKFNFRLLDELSKKYQTSITSTAIRFSEIGSHPIMIVSAKNGIVQWKWHSNDFPYHYLKGRSSKVPDDTAAGEFFQDKTTYRETEQVFAKDWFDVCDRRYNQKFYEHCLCSVQGNSTISIIWED